MKPRVFVVQIPSVYDKADQCFKSKYDLTPAEEFGTLVTCLGPGSIFRARMQKSFQQIADVMHDFTSDDYILALGDPVAIAGAVLIAGEKTNGSIKLLRYDRMTRSYEAFNCVNPKA
jgi:hypothetical protein